MFIVRVIWYKKSQSKIMRFLGKNKAVGLFHSHFRLSSIFLRISWRDSSADSLPEVLPVSLCEEEADGERAVVGVVTSLLWPNALRLFFRSFSSKLFSRLSSWRWFCCLNINWCSCSLTRSWIIAKSTRIKQILTKCSRHFKNTQNIAAGMRGIKILINKAKWIGTSAKYCLKKVLKCLPATENGVSIEFDTTSATIWSGSTIRNGSIKSSWKWR